MSMSRKQAIGIFLVALVSTISASEAAQTFPDFGYAPPQDWSQATFVLSQNYPKKLPTSGALPWESIDFRSEPEKYLWAVLRYSFEGNLEVDFDVRKNQKRGWYHAPWLHYGQNGREFVRGLTRERISQRFELSPIQTQTYRNYAVGFYNDLGGYTLGQVWRNPQKPDLNSAVFPEGTASFKLLFTTAPESIASYLQGSPEWVADIDRATSSQQILATKVRLLQIDVAVKHKQSLKGGWVFGTFQYDSSVADPNPWLRLRPLALMWGDDPNHTPADYAAGRRPKEGWINTASPIVQYRANPPVGSSPPSTLGWAGRGNGPVDNPASSCMSCHSTAQLPSSSRMTPTARLPDAQKLRWFRNTRAGEPFDAGSKTLDFSLQLGVGIQNLQDYQSTIKSLGGFFSHKLQVPGEKSRQYRFTRDPE